MVTSRTSKEMFNENIQDQFVFDKDMLNICYKYIVHVTVEISRSLNLSLKQSNSTKLFKNIFLSKVTIFMLKKTTIQT